MNLIDVKQNHNHLIINLSIMKKKLLLLNVLIFCFLGSSASTGNDFTGTSFPTGWTQSNTCNSTSSMLLGNLRPQHQAMVLQGL